MTAETRRLIPIVCAWLPGAHLLLIGLTNLTDYGVNLEFVQHVLLMDDTFGPSKSWRSIANPVVVHTFYALIIATELTVSALCLWGGIQMLRYRRAASDVFERAKQWACYGLLLGVALWFGAFVTIGGEWFLMWQSEKWNAQSTAMMMTLIYGMFLAGLCFRIDPN
jgi:predicted small integral membrane protein